MKKKRKEKSYEKTNTYFINGTCSNHTSYHNHTNPR